jgi:antirestriction protein ArdC
MSPMRNFRSNSVQRRDHYQELTDKIIAALEAGTAPWRRPWNPNACGGSTAPVNAATGHRYRGVNLFVLGISPLAFASGDPRWCSYRQALARGWQVRRGEKATPVYFYKPIEIADKTSEGEGETRRVPILRVFSVFHASQIDGIAALAPAGATKTVIERVEDAEIILKASGVSVRIGGDRAFYNQAGDFIQLPPDEAFESPALRASVALHELSHASGHPSRLNRDLSGKFGSSAYSREELRAELSSLLVGSAIGLPTDIPNHARYVRSWLDVLKQDKREIFYAAADAQRIADYILGFHPDYAERPIESADDGDDGTSSVVAPLAA